MSISYPSIIVGGLTSNTGSFSGSFYGNLSGSGLTTQITSSLISGSEGYFEELYINGVPVDTGGGISAVSSSGNVTGSGLSGDELTLKDNIELSSVTASVSGATAQFNTLNVLGTLTANELYITYETSSILYTSGSTKFGDSLDDTHEFTGSLFVTGNIYANLFDGTASYAQTAETASYALLAETASYVLLAETASYVQLAESASYTLLAETASYVLLAETASYVQLAESASYVETASYALLAETASYVLLAETASYVQLAESASYTLLAETASYVQLAESASYVFLAETASYVETASYALSAAILSSGSITGSGLIGNEIRLTDNITVVSLTASVISSSTFIVDNPLMTFNTIETDVLQVNQQSSLSGTTDISGTISLLGYATYNGVELNTGAGGVTAGEVSGAIEQLTSSQIIFSGPITSSYISSSQINTDYIDLTTGLANPAHQRGRIFWDDANDTLAMYNANANVTQQLGQEFFIRVINKSGADILNGTPVRISGATGDKPNIWLAQATDQSLDLSRVYKNEIIGVTTHDILDNETGSVTLNGIVNDIILDPSWELGDTLYLSTSAGLLTNIMPDPPYDNTIIGFLTKKNGGSGTGAIFVYTQPPQHFNDISSVSASAYSQGDLWMYKTQGSSGVWTNTKQLSGSYNVTGTLSASLGISTPLFAPYNNNPIVMGIYGAGYGNSAQYMWMRFDPAIKDNSEWGVYTGQAFIESTFNSYWEVDGDNLTLSTINGGKTYLTSKNDVLLSGSLIQVTGAAAFNSNITANSVSSSNGYAILNTPVLRTYTDIPSVSQGITLSSGSAGSVGIGSGLFNSGIIVSGSATGSFIAPNIILTASNSITSKAPLIVMGDNTTSTIAINSDQTTVAGLTLASVYSSTGIVLLSGALGVQIDASSSAGLTQIAMNASQVNINAPVVATSFSGDGSGLYNLPPAGLSHIQIPLAYNQTTTNSVNTLVGGGKINGFYYPTNVATFEILGYVANSASDTLEVELYNITDNITEAIIPLSSSITTALTSSTSINLGLYPKIFEVYIRNSTGTGNVTLLSANMLID